LNGARAKPLKSSFRSVAEGVTIFISPGRSGIFSEARQPRKIKGVPVFFNPDCERRHHARGIGFTLAYRKTKVR